ncbi:hypothetical protein [Kamptonema formosum]|uniref:hypothetical protein n=1 Tax=Kamptonema formosum TaxID=331992 RepID=UPI00034AB346|nr:hypothetical protein [Oscillatoria sp. PCC 10802]
MYQIFCFPESRCAQLSSSHSVPAAGLISPMTEIGAEGVGGLGTRGCGVAGGVGLKPNYEPLG